MAKRAIIPAGREQAMLVARMSPGIVSGDFVFLTGMTGSLPDGTMLADPETQFRNAFAKIAEVLAAEGLSLEAVVEMTSYHVGLRGHFDLFDRVRQSLFADPWPAWTAVEVAGLRRIGALVEIRVIASRV